MAGILKGKGRGRESRWARYWRKRRMNAVRNSSDHATYMAVGILVAVVVLGAVLFVALRGAKFSQKGSPSRVDFPKAMGQ